MIPPSSLARSSWQNCVQHGIAREYRVRSGLTNRLFKGRLEGSHRNGSRRLYPTSVVSVRLELTAWSRKRSKTSSLRSVR